MIRACLCNKRLVVSLSWKSTREFHRDTDLNKKEVSGLDRRSFFLDSRYGKLLARSYNLQEIIFETKIKFCLIK